MAIAGDGAAGNIFFAEVKRPFVCSACVCRTRWCRGCVCTDYGVGVGVADRAHEFIFSLSWFVELFCSVLLRACVVCEEKERGVRKGRSDACTRG